MKIKSFNEKNAAAHAEAIASQVRRAIRGSKPWDIARIYKTFSEVKDQKDKVSLFNKRIGHIFPTILDLVSQGKSLKEIEMMMNLPDRMLWSWLRRRERLADMVEQARGLRGRRAAEDILGPPTEE